MQVRAGNFEVRFTEMRQHMTLREEKSRPRGFERGGPAIALLSRLHAGEEPATPAPLVKADWHAGPKADPADRHIVVEDVPVSCGLSLERGG
jgi:hypothetical protein